MNSIVIMGRRGSGKTYLMSYLIYTRAQHSLSIDTLGDMEKIHKPFILKIHTIPNIRLMIAHYSIPIPDWIRASGMNSKEIAFNICDLIMDYGKKGYFQYPFVIAIDEIQTYCDRFELMSPLNNIVNIGRHYNISFYVNSRRYPEIHKDFIGNAEEIFAGPTMDVNDIKRMCEIFGKDNTNRFVNRNIANSFLYRNNTDNVCIARVENNQLVLYEL